jgi:hypothetical protein
VTASAVLSFDHTLFQLPITVWFYFQLWQAAMFGFIRFMRAMEVKNAS